MPNSILPAASSINGRDEARPRRKQGQLKLQIGHSNDSIPSDSGDSRITSRNERLAMRKKRIANARARRSGGGGGNIFSFCVVSVLIFAMYLITCLIFFYNLPEGGGSNGGAGGMSSMRGLVRKTKEKVERMRHRHPVESVENIVPSNALNPIDPSVPVGKWPVSIRDEDGNFEEIKHPGIPDGSISMTVPSFWADDPVALHGNKLMSRERALAIGSCLSEDPKTGSHNRGDVCPMEERTIFVAIASYRDWQCRDTVTSIFETAAHPERVRVAVVDQITAGDGSCDVPHRPCTEDPKQPICVHKSQIDVYQMEAELAVGPVFARHIGHRMYRGEYYTMQSDAHVTFTRGWDLDIISQVETTGDEMAVLSTYLTDIVGSIDPQTGLSTRHTRPIMCNTEYEGTHLQKHLRHLAQPEARPEIQGMPQLQPYWAAGFSFSRGHFVATIPYDLYQPMIFQGEEMSITLRGFTVGYDFFAPEKSVCFHSYAKGENEAARNRVPHFWEHSEKYKGTGEKAMGRLLGIVHMNPEVDPSKWDHMEEAKYGLGGARDTSKFYELYGIDVRNKTTQRHLCQFVRHKMHDKFMPFLRKNGMGIDYSSIDFKWVDPRPNDK